MFRVAGARRRASRCDWGFASGVCGSGARSDERGSLELLVEEADARRGGRSALLWKA